MNTEQLIPMEAENLLHDAVQMQAREHLQQRLAAENLSAIQRDVLDGLLDLHRAGDIYATYDAKLKNYRWRPTGQAGSRGVSRAHN
jgi:hypothetical protein